MISQKKLKGPFVMRTLTAGKRNSQPEVFVCISMGFAGETERTVNGRKSRRQKTREAKLFLEIVCYFRSDRRKRKIKEELDARKIVVAFLESLAIENEKVEVELGGKIEGNFWWGIEKFKGICGKFTSKPENWIVDFNLEVAQGFLVGLSWKMNINSQYCSRCLWQGRSWACPLEFGNFVAINALF